MKKQKRKVLSAQYIIKITQVFEKQGWKIEKQEGESSSLFNRFCERMIELEENKKRDLMLELTKNYLWIPEDKYLDYLIDALVKLIESNSEINENTKIYVMELISPSDKEKIKSSSFIVYLFNSVKIKLHNILSKYKFEIETDIERLRKKMETEDSVLILIDDYIGTGETAEKCVLHILEKGIDKRKLAVLSLVAQEMGIERLKTHDICISTSVMRKRGISDYYEGEILKNNIALMEQIEEKMSIKKQYRFGYGKAEALVTMCRTPNNTFPIFWEESGNMKVAPFPRF